jgi:hypothetical protein
MINYGDRCNFIDKIKSSLDGEYNIGDCRAWRNNINLFDPEYKWKYCAEDVCKTLINEEKGKLLYLPRILHTYAHRENSISKTKITDFTLFEESSIMMNESEQRKSRKHLNSIEDYYDRIYSHTTPFYMSKLNTDKTSSIVEYFSQSINNREKETLSNLFFDHDLRFETTENVDYLVCKIENSEDINLLSERLCFLPKKQIVIEVDKTLLEHISMLLTSLGLPFSWFLFGKMSIIVDL